MIIKQFYLGCLAHASYLVIDERTHEAAVIDPQRDVGLYMKEAAKHGSMIKYVLLTHFHADFIAGHLELRDRTGAAIYLGAKGTPEYESRPLANDDELCFGDVRLRALETPGHTPESISIVAYDLADDGSRPVGVFTGDTLFVGDVGRPDLMASVGVTAEELAGQLYDSLHQKLMTLPDETIVYPAHGAGSMCGRNLSSETTSTIGEQRRQNYALQEMTKDEFILAVTAEQPEAPSYFGYDAMLNKKERPTLEQSLKLALKALSLQRVLEWRKSDAQILDVRSPEEFAERHMAGSVNIGLDGKFATWAGTLLSRDREIVIVAEPGKEHEAATRLGRIGLDRVVGFLDGGLGSLERRPDLFESSERISIHGLVAALAAVEQPFVVDVRTPREWDGGHIGGSVNIPLSHLESRASEIPSDRPVILICRSGYRSSIAASLLLRGGAKNLVDVEGGMDAWSADDLPLVATRETACQAG